MILEFKNYRLLSLEEHSEILSIRNSDNVRNNMKSKDIIEIQEHLNWIEQLKKDTKNIYYAVFVDGVILGAVYITNIDYIKKTSTWGLYFQQNINPFVSSFSAYLLIDRVFNHFEMEKLTLEVKKENTNAYYFDLHFGFEVYKERHDTFDSYYLMFMTRDDWDIKKYQGRLKTIAKRLDKIKHQFI